jgi:hypothetical protein
MTANEISAMRLFELVNKHPKGILVHVVEAELGYRLRDVQAPMRSLCCRSGFHRDQVFRIIRERGKTLYAPGPQAREFLAAQKNLLT